MLRHTGTGPSRHLHLLTISLRSLDQLPITCEDGGYRGYGKSYTLHNGSIFDSMICSSTEGKDSCQGDSGGPSIDRRDMITTM
eukprot:scaffold8993_cov207-Skeletonema_marinoi.AAC.43